MMGSALLHAWFHDDIKSCKDLLRSFCMVAPTAKCVGVSTYRSKLGSGLLAAFYTPGHTQITPKNPVRVNDKA
jgi:hypothetical protein